MDNYSDLFLALKELKKNLKNGTDYRVVEMMEIFEGIAPFLDRQTIIRIKCSGCDNYAKASFPLSSDYWAVEKADYCHANIISLKNLKLSKLAICNKYSSETQESMKVLANSIIEDLEPFVEVKTLYDRRHFASFSIDLRMICEPGKVCIEFGHKINDLFEPFGVIIHLVKRLDPGFGPENARRLAESLKTGSTIAVECSQQSRSMLDLDNILKDISAKHKLNIVYI
ncbi:MAG: hypothetical protein MUO26_04360 [Methanotrichaceae archaeon]|nr:hypothetical protein [Methanotrichaceae archaeon]